MNLGRYDHLIDVEAYRHPEQNSRGDRADGDSRPGTPVPIRCVAPGQSIRKKPNPEGVRGSTRVCALASTRLPDSPYNSLACPEILLAAPVRTPIGKFGGGLAGLSAAELGRRRRTRDPEALPAFRPARSATPSSATHVRPAADRTPRGRSYVARDFPTPRPRSR